MQERSVRGMTYALQSSFLSSLYTTEYSEELGRLKKNSAFLHLKKFEIDSSYNNITSTAERG
jgi:hypothetical protein